jgi:hypothetical protein
VSHYAFYIHGQFVKEETMRTFAVGMIMLAAVVGSAPARSNPPAPLPDPVRAWNKLALETVRIKSASDAQAARL